ncbi:DUF7662 domain-containing protein [Bradyrhizobium sp. USDA 4469]
MSAYDPLRRYLLASQSDLVVMDFCEIEEVNCRPLLSSAHRYPAWWANEEPDKTTHSHSRAWMLASYAASPELLRRRVTFKRRR